MPVVDINTGGINIRIDIGELLFPIAAFIFCVAYFIETRGLPDQSLLYADPLLYTTALLAVVTGLGHALSINRRRVRHRDDQRQVRPEDTKGTAGRRVEQSPEGESPKPKDHREIFQGGQSPEDHFTVASATGLIVLTTGYIASLYFVPFVAATAVFLAASVVLFGERNPLKILTYSGGFTLLLWLTFVNWLRVPLP